MSTDCPIVLGLWPIAGITSVGVTEQHSRATIRAAIDAGITRFDTAFSYGYDGGSDRLLGSFVRGSRDDFQVIGKVGQYWNEERKRLVDGSAKRLTADAETSLRRIGIEHFDLLMLHSPDPNVPIEQSAMAIADLKRRGLCSQIGVCNVNPHQLRRFAGAVDCDAIQCPLNLLQRNSLESLIPDCADAGREVLAFWTLMKGLLAGRISRDHQFAENDVRPRYDIYQGAARDHAHDVLDRMKVLAEETGLTIAQLSIGWTLAQPGVTAALVGAKRPEQIQETAAARPLAEDAVKQIDAMVAG